MTRHFLRDDDLAPAEQRAVLEVTRTPVKVRWPDWWEVSPK